MDFLSETPPERRESFHTRMDHAAEPPDTTLLQSIHEFLGFSEIQDRNAEVTAEDGSGVDGEAGEDGEDGCLKDVLISSEIPEDLEGIPLIEFALQNGISMHGLIVGGTTPLLFACFMFDEDLALRVDLDSCIPSFGIRAFGLDV